MSMDLREMDRATASLAETPRLPALFIGHGNPMNALYDNPFTRSLASLGGSLRALKPAAILVVSAHWLTRGTRVSMTATPETIHDFGGFPEELFNVQYPAPGAPLEAQAARELLGSVHATGDDEWGLDHGAWSVLRHMVPAANIPVFQVSIDYYAPPEAHFRIGADLRRLRRKGVLVIGSGNIVHNLRRASFDEAVKPFDWALEFDAIVKSKLESGSYGELVNYPSLGTAASLAVPTNDHYLPMLYALGLAEPGEQLAFTYEEIQNASISMRCFQLGGVAG
jgi:4,5-DOPA dioxygenase extradiol